MVGTREGAVYLFVEPITFTELLVQKLMRDCTARCSAVYDCLYCLHFARFVPLDSYMRCLRLLHSGGKSLILCRRLVGVI